MKYFHYVSYPTKLKATTAFIPTDESNFEEILEYAIEKEENSIKYYRQLLNIVHDKYAKKMIQQLITEEIRHKNELEKFLDLGEECFQIGPIHESKKLNLSFNQKLDSNATKKDVLLYAIKQEKESFELYREMAKMVNHPMAKDTLVKLSRLELTHKKKLEHLLQKLSRANNIPLTRH